MIFALIRAASFRSFLYKPFHKKVLYFIFQFQNMQPSGACDQISEENADFDELYATLSQEVNYSCLFHYLCNG